MFIVLPVVPLFYNHTIIYFYFDNYDSNIEISYNSNFIVLLFSIFSYMLYRQKLQERLAEISTAV